MSNVLCKTIVSLVISTGVCAIPQQEAFNICGKYVPLICSHLAPFVRI